MKTQRGVVNFQKLFRGRNQSGKKNITSKRDKRSGLSSGKIREKSGKKSFRWGNLNIRGGESFFLKEVSERGGESLRGPN